MNTATRIGSVEMDDVRLIAAPSLEESGDYRRMSDRLQVSEAVIDSLRERGDLRLDELLTQALDGLVGEGKVEGLLIGSEDGFVVAQSTRLDRGELLAVVGILFESAVRRIQEERLIDAVEEMGARGAGGEQVILRYFPGMERRFFLLAYSRQPAAYRRTTARALRICGEILARSVGAKVRGTRRRVSSAKTAHPPASWSPEPGTGPGREGGGESEGEGERPPGPTAAPMPEAEAVMESEALFPSALAGGSDAQ
jgi:hypothetical protein